MALTPTLPQTRDSTLSVLFIFTDDQIAPSASLTRCSIFTRVGSLRPHLAILSRERGYPTQHPSTLGANVMYAHNGFITARTAMRHVYIHYIQHNRLAVRKPKHAYACVHGHIHHSCVIIYTIRLRSCFPKNTFSTLLCIKYSILWFQTLVYCKFLLYSCLIGSIVKVSSMHQNLKLVQLLMSIVIIIIGSGRDK